MSGDEPEASGVDFESIPVVDAAPLFGGDRLARDAADESLGRACREVGFVVITGVPEPARLDAAARRRLLAFFDLPDDARYALGRRQNNPANTNVYRGWFPALEGERSYKEGIDVGPDIGPDDPRVLARVALFEPNAWPPEEALPGWRAAMNGYFVQMTAVGHALMRSVARHLGLGDAWFEPLFEGSNSSLRLLRYPVPDARVLERFREPPWREHEGRRRYCLGFEHTDSGCLTLLCQDATPGLQVRNGSGAWIDVPPIEGGLVVNIGDTLERSTNGAFRSTTHRVLGSERERHSIPFFFEPATDTVIECLPGCEGDGGPRFAPVRYGDHLVGKLKGYSEFRALFAGEAGGGAPG